jgi:branched-chain amino acid transport system substrate-binding protein
MRRSTRWLAVPVALTLVAAACGGDDDSATDTEAPAPTEAPAATDAPADTEAPAATDAPAETEAPADTEAPESTDAPATTEAAGGDALTCDGGVTIGVITDETGALAIYGSHMLRGVPIGFAYATDGEVQTSAEQTYMIDDCEVRVVYKDDQSDPEQSATAARELIEVEGASIIIGSVSSGVTATLQEVARENDVILIAAPAAANDLTGSTFNENTFRASRNNYQDAMAICEQFVNGDGFETFIQIAPDYSFGYGGAAAYEDACTALGGEFLQDAVFAPADTTDFTSYLSPLADSGADAFLVTWAGGGFVPLLQGAIDLGVINDETVLGSPFVDNVVMPAFFANAIGTTSVVLYHYDVVQDNEINQYLIDQAAANFDALPDLFDADGMNAAIMAVEALKATGGATDADSLRSALEGMSFEGPKGTIDIRPEDHVAIQDMYIVTLTNVDDPEFKYYDYVGTVRPEPPCLLEGDFVSRCGDLPVGSLTGS